MIAGEVDGHHLCGDDLAVADDGLLDHRADREDARLRRVDHRGEESIPSIPRLETVKVPPESSGGVTVAVADPLGQRPGLRGDLRQPLEVGVEDGRDDQARRGLRPRRPRSPARTVSKRPSR